MYACAFLFFIFGRSISKNKKEIGTYVTVQIKKNSAQAACYKMVETASAAVFDCSTFYACIRNLIMEGEATTVKD
jgi:hypothetical protein